MNLILNEALCCQESRSREDKTAVFSQLPAKYRNGWRMKQTVNKGNRGRGRGRGGEREREWGEGRRKVGSRRKGETGRGRESPLPRPEHKRGYG